jgi:hypothetical protein
MNLQENDQPTSDEYPEIEVNEETGTVTLKNEQQPEVKPEEQAQPEPEQVTEPATPETEQPEVNPLEQEFRNAGLDKQFGDLAGMVKAVPGLNQAYTQTRQELAEIRRQLWEQQNKKPPEPEIPLDTDAFLENPAKVIDAYIDRKLSAQKADVESKFDMMEAQKFVDSKPDIIDLVPIMEQEMLANPGLNTLPAKERIQILYKMAKASQIPAIVQSVTNTAKTPTPDKAKAEAGTKGVTKPKVVGEKTHQQWIEMTPEEIEKEIGVVDR